MTPDVSSAPPLSINDPRFALHPGVSATYMVTVTLDQSIIDSAQSFTIKLLQIEFVTPWD